MRRVNPCVDWKFAFRGRGLQRETQPIFLSGHTLPGQSDQFTAPNSYCNSSVILWAFLIGIFAQVVLVGGWRRWWGRRRRWRRAPAPISPSSCHAPHPGHRPKMNRHSCPGSASSGSSGRASDAGGSCSCLPPFASQSGTSCFPGATRFGSRLGQHDLQSA